MLAGVVAERDDAVRERDAAQSRVHALEDMLAEMLRQQTAFLRSLSSADRALLGLPGL